MLLEGKAVRSCVTPLSAAVGKKIITIEGLATSGSLHPMQQAFLRQEAFQCGYCTCGMILSAVALLSTNPSPSAEAILQSMQGNICRCGTYPRIVTAVRDAAGSFQKAK